MAIIRNLSSGLVRSTKRILPGLFTPDKNRNVRRYRSIGGGSTPQEVCDPTVCNGAIRDKDERGCWFEVGCDDPETP